MAFDGRPTIFEESERQPFRLVYASRPASAVAGRRGAAVGEMLVASLRNNPYHEVTGLLLVHDDWVLQVLEGPRAGVRATYRKIERDARHHGVTVLSAEVVGERAFPEWSMLGRFMSDIDPAMLAKLGVTADFDPFTQPVAAALKLLTSVGEAQEDGRFANVQALRARLAAA